MDNKIICGCFNITLYDLEDQITKGTNSFKEFQEKTGVGTGCPPCLAKNKILFDKMLNQYQLSLLIDILVL